MPAQKTNGTEQPAHGLDRVGSTPGHSRERTLTLSGGVQFNAYCAMHLNRQTQRNQPVMNGAQEGVFPGPKRHLVDHLEPVGRESQVGFSHTLSVQQTFRADSSYSLMLSVIG
jgi:hypothetical protein